MKIIDGFIFNNEFELLKYRLDTLSEYVDYFIIVESKHTFVGKQKPLFFTERIVEKDNQFTKHMNKIIHITTQAIFDETSIDISANQQWLNEFDQRNKIADGLNKILDLNNNDIFMISDVDEIPDREILKKIKETKFLPLTVLNLEQDMYYYNLNTPIGKWYHAKLLTYELFKGLNTTCSEIRNGLYNFDKCILNCGWHLSYFGDKNYIRNKIENFSHQEFNKSEYIDLNSIENCIEQQIDLFNRKENETTHIFQKKSISENNYLPYEYDTYLSKYILY